MVEVPEGYALPYGARHKMLQRNFTMQVFKAERGRVWKTMPGPGNKRLVDGFVHHPIGVVTSNEDGIKFDMLPASGTWKEAETVQAAIIAICTIHRMRGGE